MKKIFTLAAAMLFTASMFAATETSANTGTADAAVVGTSYTIPGAYIAGKGGAQVTPMPNKGIKVRLNSGNKGGKNDTLVINVNKGYKITALTFTGVTNTDNKAATIGSIAIDGKDWNGVFVTTLPAKNASAAANIAVTGINATQSILFAFSDLGGATQANICLEVTYEITATTYVATYKANYGEVEDVVDNAALAVADNMFDGAEGTYFVGWNTAADGTGDAVAIGAELTANITLYAQWKTFVACATLDLSGAEQTPAKDAEVLLTETSNGGKIFFAGAKDDLYEESFIAKAGKGIQLSKGAADSLRVVLNSYIAKGSVIRVDMIAVNEGSVSINVVAGKTSIPMSAKAAKETKKSVYLIVEDDNVLIGKNIFYLQRTESVVVDAVAIANCGENVPTGFENVGINGKAVKVIRDGQVLILRDGKMYNALGVEVK